MIVEPKEKVKSKVNFSPEIQEESQVIVHCTYRAQQDGEGIRIWPSTYLVDQHSDHVSRLVHVEKISMFPNWTWLPKGAFSFTLIFSGLPKSCIVFDFIEDCNGAPGSFFINGIKRTYSDIYHVDI